MYCSLSLSLSLHASIIKWHWLMKFLFFINTTLRVYAHVHRDSNASAQGRACVFGLLRQRAQKGRPWKFMSSERLETMRYYIIILWLHTRKHIPNATTFLQCRSAYGLRKKTNARILCTDSSILLSRSSTVCFNVRIHVVPPLHTFRLSFRVKVGGLMKNLDLVRLLSYVKLSS